VYCKRIVFEGLLPIYFFVNNFKLKEIGTLEDVIVRKYLKFFHSDYYLENPKKKSYPQNNSEYKIISKIMAKSSSECIFKIQYKDEMLILKYFELLDERERPKLDKQVHFYLFNSTDGYDAFD
jgi:hypothetical protein